MKSVIIGYGRISDSIRHDKLMEARFGTVAHVENLWRHPQYELLGVVDPDVHARTSAYSYGVPCVVDNVDNLDFEPEFAVLAIPSRFRLAALEKMPKLKAVLLEKPMGREGEYILEHCKFHDIRAYTNYWRRAVPDFQQLASGRLEELIGEPQAVFATYGNGLYNNGSHLIDFIRMLFGGVIKDVKSISCERISVQGCSGSGDDLHASFALDMGHYVIHVAPLDYNHYREFSLDIWGTEGRYFLGSESLNRSHYKVVSHRAMVDQKEMMPTPFASGRVDVGSAYYNVYNMIATDTMPRADMVTQEVLDKIANA